AGKIVASALLVVGRSALVAPPGPQPHTVRLVMATVMICCFRHAYGIILLLQALARRGPSQNSRAQVQPKQPEPTTIGTRYNRNRLQPKPAAQVLPVAASVGQSVHFGMDDPVLLDHQPAAVSRALQLSDDGTKIQGAVAQGHEAVVLRQVPIALPRCQPSPQPFQI